MSIEAVIFDLGGTLVHTRPPETPADPWLAYLRAAAPSRGTGPVERLLAGEHAAWLACRDEGRSCTLAAILEFAGLDANETGLRSYHEYWQERSRFDAAAAEVLGVVRRSGLKIGLLSNTIWPGFWHDEDLRQAQLGHLFDAVVYSSDLPYAKPHPGAFRSVLRSLGVVDPARAVHVGDRSFEDVFGAHAAGLRAALVQRGDAPSAPVAVVPDARIETLAALPRVLRGWHVRV